MEPLEADDPRQAGPYTLLGRLGAGGMGAVYLGRSAGGRTVAVKLVRREFAADEDFRARFRREVEAARAVSGAFTASVVDADTEAALPWLATTFVPGVPLSAAVRRHGGFAEPVLRALGVGLAEALQEIHRAGVIHRDLKPANVMLAADGPHVIDFGISRAVEGAALTSTGFVVGSPGFLSPEQAMGNQVVPATDVFALGATLAFAAHGNGPFGDGPTPALLYRVVSQEPDLSAVPEALRPAVRACLAKDPANRPTPAQLVAALSESAPDFTGGWLPPAVLADIAAAGAVLTGTAAAPAPAAAPAQVPQSAPQGFGPPTPAPFPAPQYPHPQQGRQPQQGYPTPPPFAPPAYPPAYPQQPQQHPQQPQFGPATPPLPLTQPGGGGSGLSRRGLLGLIGGGVVVLGGAATAFALSGSGGGKPTPAPTTSGSATGTPTAAPSTGAPAPTGGPGTAPAGPVTPVTAPGTLAGPAAKALWTQVLNDTVWNLAVGSGTVVAVCTQSTKGLKTADGSSQWRGTADNESGTISTIPLIVGDTAYLVGSNSDGNEALLVVDLASGDTKWQVVLHEEGWELEGAYGISGGNLLMTANTTVGVGVNGLWAVDISTHQSVYTRTGSYIGSLVVPPTGSTVVSFNEIGDNGAVSGIDATTGDRTWTATPQGATFGGTGAVDSCLVDGVVYTGGNDVNAYRVATGAPAWQGVSYNPDDLGYNSPVGDGQGRCFVTADSTLYCFRPSDGSKLWSTSGVNSFIIDKPMLTANGMVYLADSKGVLYAVDAATGACAWSYTNPAATTSDNLALAADSSGVYYGVGTQVVALPVR
ncbi:PQQ-binding-like beta-propeller repeat protein [Streptacidiphilus sp. PB12-B1b]|uniref:serine/threonine-protein kinase n=1 Tax=Streptacidiphilus sp. PB12-B1b TaxID=2705012 RepID=UPI0015F987EF|nr:serine/threonine-protein kinase [Streptacidiphilus sp. PB12-B1b]QMU75179.1 PQQ-binding-like beta-propeller repeat protein [Streptacidiphilus sp. PB12-B1b]